MTIGNIDLAQLPIQKCGKRSGGVCIFSSKFCYKFQRIHFYPKLSPFWEPQVPEEMVEETDGDNLRKMMLNMKVERRPTYTINYFGQLYKNRPAVKERIFIPTYPVIY